MTQWYLQINGEEKGPMDKSQADFLVKMNPGALARQDTFSEWHSVSRVPEFGGTPQAAPPPTTPAAPPGAQSPASSGGVIKSPSSVNSDEVDYTIYGTEMQFVEVELDPGESAVAEAGAMMYKDSHVEMETIFGDGSKQSGGGGFMDKLLGAGKRLLTGESLFMTVFTHQGQGKAHVAFGAPFPGNIIPVSLATVGGCLICQKDSFLCAAKGVTIGIHLQRKIMTGLFGGEGFIMQKLEGDGMTFIHAGGTVIERVLEPGEVLHVDTGCVVAYEPGVQFDIQQAGGIKTMLFGGEGFFFATMMGPGKIWLQSLPFSRLAGRMLQAAPQGGGSSKGEGSVLGTLGGFLNGDNS